jgi:hypothetical protein
MEDLLELIAQLAITIAALSAVAGASRSNTSTSTNLERHFLLRDVALIGMAVALYSVIPLLLDEAGVDSDLTMAACGGLAASAWLIGYALYIKRIWGDKTHFTGQFFLGCILTIGGLASFSWAAVFENEIAYLCGLVCWLVIASFNFINGVFALDPKS